MRKICSIGLVLSIILATAFGFHRAISQTSQRNNSESIRLKQAEAYKALNPKWRSCKGSQECEKITFDCFDSIAINKAYLTEARKKICQRWSCDWLTCTAKTHELYPVCSAKVCEISRSSK